MPAYVNLSIRVIMAPGARTLAITHAHAHRSRNYVPNVCKTPCGHREPPRHRYYLETRRQYLAEADPQQFTERWCSLQPWKIHSFLTNDGIHLKGGQLATGYKHVPFVTPVFLRLLHFLPRSSKNCIPGRCGGVRLPFQYIQLLNSLLMKTFDVVTNRQC